MTGNHSNILENWGKFQMMPYADFNVCWFQLCTHIQIVPICCLKVWVAKSHMWGDEGRTGNAYSLNVEDFLGKKKPRLCLFISHGFGFVMVPGHTPVFTECMQVQQVYRQVICFGYVLSQLDLCLLSFKIIFHRCSFRLLDSWWIFFQEFLVSVSFRLLLQPTSAIVKQLTFSKQAGTHIYLWMFILPMFLLHLFHILLVFF